MFYNFFNCRAIGDLMKSRKALAGVFSGVIFLEESVELSGFIIGNITKHFPQYENQRSGKLISPKLLCKYRVFNPTTAHLITHRPYETAKGSQIKLRRNKAGLGQ